MHCARCCPPSAGPRYRADRTRTSGGPRHAPPPLLPRACLSARAMAVHRGRARSGPIPTEPGRRHPSQHPAGRRPADAAVRGCPDRRPSRRCPGCDSNHQPQTQA
eukprot:scaffold18035_cov106-Isochrysis_galbana.AAC.1